jgi:dihydrofolate reductase
MIIAHLVAADENNVIGGNNKLPWHLPNDLKYFKNRSWGLPVIMGRKTFESVNKPLPGRKNIVITSNRNWSFEGVDTAFDLQHALDIARQTDAKEIFIIGGGEVFRQSMQIVNRIYLTRVHAAVDGDVYYPPLEANRWQLTSTKKFNRDEKHAYDYTFEVYELRND